MQDRVRRWLVVGFVVILFLLPRVSAGTFNYIATEATLHNAATATGVSPVVSIAGYTDWTIQLTLAGTANVEVEVSLDTLVWKAVTGCTLSANGGYCSSAGLVVPHVRTNITLCTSCTVTTKLYALR